MSSELDFLKADRAALKSLLAQMEGDDVHLLDRLVLAERIAEREAEIASFHEDEIRQASERENYFASTSRLFRIVDGPPGRCVKFVLNGDANDPEVTIAAFAGPECVEAASAYAHWMNSNEGDYVIPLLIVSGFVGMLIGLFAGAVAMFLRINGGG